MVRMEMCLKCKKRLVKFIDFKFVIDGFFLIMFFLLWNYLLVFLRLIFFLFLCVRYNSYIRKWEKVRSRGYVFVGINW